MQIQRRVSESFHCEDKDFTQERGARIPQREISMRDFELPLRRSRAATWTEITGAENKFMPVVIPRGPE